VPSLAPTSPNADLGPVFPSHRAGPYGEAMTSVGILAAEGGWGELVMVSLPIFVIAVLLVRARHRVIDGLTERADTDQADTDRADMDNESN
jgi:hypothetical protein